MPNLVVSCGVTAEILKLPQATANWQPLLILSGAFPAGNLDSFLLDFISISDKRKSLIKDYRVPLVFKYAITHCNMCNTEVFTKLGRMFKPRRNMCHVICLKKPVPDHHWLPDKDFES